MESQTKFRRLSGTCLHRLTALKERGQPCLRLNWLRRHSLLDMEFQTTYHRLSGTSPYLRKEFWQEVEAGNIAPGDKLTVTGYSWLLRDYLMTVSTEEKDLGNFRDFNAWRSRDVHGMRITAFIVPCLGLLCGFLVWRLERKDLWEIQKLRRKYRERIRQEKS